MLAIRFLHIAYPVLKNVFSPFLWVQVFSVFQYPEKKGAVLYINRFQFGWTWPDDLAFMLQTQCCP